MESIKRSFIASLAIGIIAAAPLFADNSTENTKAEEEVAATPELDTRIEYKTRTVYEGEFFPGVRWCEDKEVDYRGDFRRVNCQDEAIIESVSTRDQDYFDSKPHAIVEDRVAPNGNLLRIKFRKKIVANEPKSSNN